MLTEEEQTDIEEDILELQSQKLDCILEIAEIEKDIIDKLMYLSQNNT